MKENKFPRYYLEFIISWALVVSLPKRRILSSLNLNIEADKELNASILKVDPVFPYPVIVDLAVGVGVLISTSPTLFILKNGMAPVAKSTTEKEVADVLLARALITLS